MYEEIKIDNTTLYKWQIGSSVFLTCPQKGAKLLSWNLSLANNDVKDVIFWPINSSLENLETTQGGIPLLFPFAGTSTFEGELNFWKSPEGEKLPMPQHGFAKNCQFEILQLKDNGFEARLIENDETKKMYPYKYELIVKYIFRELTINAEIVLKNLDDKNIVWRAGFHPYFNMPWNANTSSKNYKIKIDAKQMYNFSNNGLEKLKDKRKEFSCDDESIRNRFFMNLKNNEAQILDMSEEEFVKIKILNSDEKINPNNAFVTWNKSNECGYMCVEPWLGPIGANSTKNGLQEIEPFKEKSFCVEFSLM